MTEPPESQFSKAFEQQSVQWNEEKLALLKGLRLANIRSIF